MDEKQLQALFGAMGTQLGLNDFNSFKSNISSDPKFRKAFFDEASQELELGDYASFDNSFKKKDGGTVSQGPLPKPREFPSVSILKEFPNQRPVSESTAVPGLKDQMAAIEFAQKGKPIFTVLESAKSTIDNALQNSDKIITRIIREGRVSEFDKQRKATPALDAFVNPAAETAKRELLVNSIVTPEEVEAKKAIVVSDDTAARDVLSRAAKENPNVGKSAYIIDAEARIKENENIAPKVLKNISLIENGELNYDIKSGKLQKPEGVVKSTIRGLQERYNQISDYEFLAGTKNDDAILSQLEADRKSFDPDDSVPVPSGNASEFFQMVGMEGIPMIKSAAAAVITSAIPGAQVAAPYVAAFVTSPEYFKRSYSTGFRQAYYNLREQGKPQQEALEIARKQAESEGIYGAIEGAASSFIGARVGFKPTPIVASKSLKDIAKNVILTGKNFITDNLPEGIADAGVAGSLQMAKNIEAINNGVNIDLFDGVADNITGELSFTIGMGLLTKAGSTVVNANTYKTVLSSISKESKQNIDSKLGEMIVDGEITPQQADETAKKIEEFKSISSQVPEEIKDDATRAEIVSKIEEKNKLEQKLKSTNPVFHQEIKDKIKDIDQQILNTYNNATQESKVTEGLPEGGVVQPTRIEAGQPQEGQGEGGQGQGEVTPADASNRPISSEGEVAVEEIPILQKETENKIKRKDLFIGVGEFANTLGGSDKESVPVSHVENNGVELVKYANPNTGIIDVVVTGTGDNDYVGFYRIYENGNPTNKWSSKLENQSGNKENFKTMISNVQSVLPLNHEYTEKTSISTDGLRVWAQQLNKGYEIQRDKDGNIITNQVAINGDAKVNELGIPVKTGEFKNISIINPQQFESVKKALIPYLEKLGLDESNIRSMNGTVMIDLPVLKSTKSTSTSSVSQGQAASQQTSNVESPLPKKDWAIITATQESVGAADSPANVEANNKLKQELIDEFGKENVLENDGVYLGVPQGKSFTIKGISSERAMEIGSKYSQESVLTNDGNVFSDGSGFNPSRGNIIVGEEAKKQSGYSILPDGTAFSLDIEWDKKLPMSQSKSRISKAISQAIPMATKSLEQSGIKFQVVNPQTDTDAARLARGNQGLFISEDGTIIIDESKLADEVEAGIVVWHEASHPVMNIIRNTNKPLYDGVVRGLNEAAKNNAGVSAALNWAQSQPEYNNEDTQNDEAIVETIGRINAGVIDINSLDTGLKQKLIEFINNIAKAFGIKPILNDTDIAAFKKTVSEVADALKTGRDIGEIVGQENVKDFKASAPQAQVEGLFKKEETPRFKSLSEVAKYIEDWANKNKLFDKSIEDVSDNEVIKKFTDHVLKEINAWESINKDYIGFYDQDIPIRLNPELQNFAKIRYGRNLDAHEVSLYHIVSSFASPSADPVFDSSKGLEVFDMFMQEYAKNANARPSGYTNEQATIWDTINGKRVDTGKLKFNEKGAPVMKQVAKAYAIDSLDKLNRVIDYFNGDFKKSIEWLESVHSYEDVSAVLGTPLKGDKSLKQHEYLDKVNGGFGVFGITGPKLGSYILNRVGEYSTVTKDMWYARTMARLAGENIVDKDGNVLKTPWDTTKSGVRKRKLADEAFRNVAKKLNTTPADVQQKIWDFEKRLYEKLGAVEKTGYASEGFMKKAKELEPSITNKQLSAGNRKASELQKNEAAKTQGFFSDVVKGLSDKYKPIKEWVPVLSFDKGQEGFKNVFDKYMGNFDLHIATSIPTFRETQVKVGNAIVDMYKSGVVYDLGGSEGGFVKAITEASKGNIKTINLDPNPDMKAVHEATPVKGSEFVQEAFLSGFEENGITYETHTPKSKADVVHESMMFQFITPEREAFIKEVSDKYLKNDGLFITEEKFSQNKEQYDNNEKKKAKYKDEYYTKEQQAMKSDDVLVGMKENQANIDTYKNILKDKFKYVEQYWDSGNFKGFVASNSKSKVDEFMDKVGSTESEFTTTPLKNNEQASVGRRTETDLGTGKEKTRGLAKRFEDLPTATASKIEEEAIKYFERTNKQTKDAVLEFMEGKSNSDLADFVVSNPDIDDVSLVWMAAEVAKNLTKEIDQAKGDKALIDELSTKQARIYNQFAKKATSLGQAVQAFVAFSDDPNATKFMLNKIIKQLKDKGMKEVSEEQIDEISKLLDNVSKAKEGLPKDEAVIKLSHYLAGIAPVNGFEILQAIWYAKILSGVTTQSKNLFANLFNTSFELVAASTVESLKNKSLMPYMYAIKGLGGGFAKGAVKGLDILLTGVKKQDEGKYFRENALESFSWGRTKLGKAGKILDFPLFIGISPKSLRMVGRALSAADAVFSSANQEAMANMLAWAQASKEGKTDPTINNFKRANEILGNTKKVIGDAKKTALSEGYKAGTTTYKRRVIELVDQARPKKVTKAGEDFGQRVTLNFEPEGFTRPVYDMVVAAQQKAPLLKMWIPFTRIVANLSEQMINYSPFGFYRAISGKRNPFGSSKDVLTNEERGELAIKAAMGLTAVGILSQVVGDDDDDWFDVTANGTGDMKKNYELQKGGWRPYTITLKNGEKINYADWPIRGLIAGVGAVKDAQKYSETEMDFANTLTIGALGFTTSMYESSLMKGLADFIDIFRPSRGKYDGIGDGLKKWSAQQAKSVLISNFTQQGLKMIDEYQGDPIKEAKGAEIIYRDIPVINDGLNPIIDVFGDPVKPTTSEKLLPYYSVSDDKKDKLIKFLNDNKIFVGVPAKRNVIDLNTEEEIPMTDKQYYDYKKLYGQKLKSYLYEYLDEYKGEDVDTIKAYVDSLKGAANAEAESELFYE